MTGDFEDPPIHRQISEITIDELLLLNLSSLPLDQRMEAAPRIWLAAQEASANRAADPDNLELDARFRQLWEAKSNVCEGFTDDQITAVYEEAGRLHQQDLPPAS